jgi:tetratricopeptide (TPR) repeat protein
MKIDALWDPEDLHASKSRFDAALAATDDPQEQVLCLSQLARIAGLEADFTQGEMLLEQARNIGPDAPREARLLLEKARLEREEGRSAQAATGFHQAAQRGRAAGALDVAMEALHLQAESAPTPIARALVEQAESICANSPSHRRYLGPMYSTFAWALFEEGDFKAAYDIFRQDHELRRSLKTEEKRRAAGVNMAKMLRYMGRLSEALEQLQRLTVEIGPQGYGLSLVFEERAELAHTAGRHSEARQYAADARARLIARGLSAEDQPSRFARLDVLAGEAPPIR